MEGVPDKTIEDIIDKISKKITIININQSNAIVEEEKEPDYNRMSNDIYEACNRTYHIDDSNQPFVYRPPPDCVIDLRYSYIILDTDNLNKPIDLTDLTFIQSLLIREGGLHKYRFDNYGELYKFTDTKLIETGMGGIYLLKLIGLPRYIKCKEGETEFIFRFDINIPFDRIQFKLHMLFD